jgi:hypothetical protein
MSDPTLSRVDPTIAALVREKAQHTPGTVPLILTRNFAHREVLERVGALTRALCECPRPDIGDNHRSA